MDQTILKVAVASLSHDIGKFADNDCLDLAWQDLDEADKQLYLPSYKGRYSHFHALYTAEFFKRYRNLLPLELQSDSWGDGDSMISLAAGHHKPSTAMQWTIAVADRVSSGLDRDSSGPGQLANQSWKKYKQTRMMTIFEQLSLNTNRSAEAIVKQAFGYPLSTLSADSIFPLPLGQVVPRDDASASSEYRTLFKSFVNGLEQLRHKDRFELWLEHFDSLLMLHTSSVPSDRSGRVLPDVSLYDHSRATAALAVAIYGYHLSLGSLNADNVQSYADPKFLFIQGDFQGIQSFIFSPIADTQRHRSKLLRGRSFAVSLMTELAADRLCRCLDLPFTSVVLNAAGKFTVIAPNTLQTVRTLATVEEEINDWLVKNTFGETRIAISSMSASCGDLVSGSFCKMWDRFCLQAAEKKFTGFDVCKYGGAINGFLDAFHNLPDQPAICPVCGKRPSMPIGGTYSVDDVTACRLCRDHIFLGTQVVKRKQMAVLKAKPENTGKERGLFEPFFGVYQVAFSDPGQEDQLSENEALRIWRWGTATDALSQPEIAIKFINGYVPCYTDEELETHAWMCETGKDGENPPLPGEPMTLNHIAAFALGGDEGAQTGTEALGVLKADVDQMGALIACGLVERRHTLSRMATMSRQFNWFFALYLPYLLAETPGYRTTYTVFAGGDDLFLIGPWNRITTLASDLSRAFRRYVCGNGQVTFSAGITLHKPHSPVGKLAAAAEEALEQSKNSQRNRLTLFGETVTWEVYEQLRTVEVEMKRWIDEGLFSRVMLYRLNFFIAMAACERQLRNRAEIGLADMACTKWRSLLVYSTERNVGKQFKGEARRQAVVEVTGQLAKWLEQFGGGLRIPLWTILYNQR